MAKKLFLLLGYIVSPKPGLNKPENAGLKKWS